MPAIPIRELGKIGVVTDVSPWDLPLEAISDARNVRFAEGRISNSHVFRTAIGSPTGSPVFSFSAESLSGYDMLGYVTSDGKAYHVSNAVATDVTETAYTPAATSATVTFCQLQGVYYLNQADRVPWFFDSGSTDYEELTNWDSNDTCLALRSFKDCLIALNVTKSAAIYPNMVKWSNFALYDSVPDSWDPSDTTKSAGENTLGEVTTEILDGLQLRNSFIIYAADQVWNMEFDGGPAVFQFFKLYGDRGIINTNCVVEVDGAHFVFDDEDIYIHDGVSPPKSIADGRVRKKIFKFLDLTKRTKCFVYHDRTSHEVWFAYNSKDPNLKWEGESCDYCNVAAVYNYVSDTWSFYDLPNVASACALNWQTGDTYGDASGLTYENIGSSYIDLMDSTTKSTFCISVINTAEGISATRILNVDNGILIALSFTACSECEVEPYAERIGLDLDEAVPELRTYKNYRAIYPQMTSSESVNLEFQFGGCDYPMQDIEWDELQTFDPYTEYKVDTRSRGRYLSWRFEGANVNQYSLSGFDLDLAALSRR